MSFVIPTYFTAINKFSQPLAQMKAGVISFGNELSATQAKAAMALNNTASSWQQLAFTSGGAAMAILVPLGLATKKAMDFEKQMTNVATIVDTNKESMSAMGNEVMEIAKRVPVAISDLTESLYQIRSAGIDSAHAMDVLEQSAKLSVAGLSTATEATKAVTSAMVSFKNEHLSASRITDIFMQTVASGKTKMNEINEAFGKNAIIVADANIKLEEFMAATAALTNTGMPASEAMNSLAASIISLHKPTKQMLTVFEQLGVATGDQLIDKMGGLVPALVAINEEVKKAAPGVLEMNKVFGRKEAYVSSTALTHDLSDSFNKILPNMKNAGVLNEAFAKQLGTSASQTALMANQLHILGVKIGTLLMPVLLGLVKVLTWIIKPITWFVDTFPIFSKVILGVAAAFGVLLGLVTLGSIAMWAWNKALLFAMGQTAILQFLTSLRAGFILLIGATDSATLSFNLLNGSLRTTLLLLGAVLYLYEKIQDSETQSKEFMRFANTRLPQDINKERFNAEYGGQGAFDAYRKLHPNENLMPTPHELDTYDQLKKQFEDYKEEQKTKMDSLANVSYNPPNIDNSNAVNVYVNGQAQVTATDNRGNTNIINRGGYTGKY